jgi:hypothetical protein
VATYSLNIKGARATSLFQVSEVGIDDLYVAPGDRAAPQAMSLNTPMLCKGPDGRTNWYVYDAERTIPGVQRVLKRV